MIWAVIAVLVIYNVVGNLWLPGWAYVPVNLAVTASIYGLGLLGGATHRTIGFSRSSVPRGLLWGTTIMVTIGAVIALGVLIPFTRSFFEDDRAAVSLWGMLYNALIRVPFGTVALEEISFRGVLLALLFQRTGYDRAGRWKAALWSSVLFGLWHIIPGWEALGSNAAVGAVADTLWEEIAAVGGAVVSTFIAGMVFCWLRLRPDSLIPPIMTHVATNSLSYVGAWVVLTLVS
ncbi:MAG: CPBP family intramembrane metalloprotease [Acidimicrobiia bacterium]|nr:CPBP family intramembrane metalloprotease [Acidimicrobiia bacterium]